MYCFMLAVLYVLSSPLLLYFLNNYLEIVLQVIVYDEIHLTSTFIEHLLGTMHSDMCWS